MNLPERIRREKKARPHTPTRTHTYTVRGSRDQINHTHGIYFIANAITLSQRFCFNNRLYEQQGG